MLLTTCKVPWIAALVAAGVLATVVSAHQGTPRALASPARLVASPEAHPADLGGPHVRPANGQAPRPATRVIQWRITDAQGRPVREGRVMFGPRTSLASFDESGMAVVDVEGHFRIELSGFPFDPFRSVG
jgi:hypothetical protein